MNVSLQNGIVEIFSLCLKTYSCYFSVQLLGYTQDEGVIKPTPSEADIKHLNLG